MKETFATLLTARGRGGIAVVRIEGGRAQEVLQRFFVSPRGTPDPGGLRYGRLERRGDLLDEVIVRCPARDVVEICLHGGPVPVERVIAAVEESGVPFLEGCAARLARWARGGRHTLRLEIEQALETARGEQSVRFLAALSEGALERTVRDLARRLLAVVRGRIEPGSSVETLEGLLRFSSRAMRVADETRVVLVGPPNAGKSTLFNRILRTDRVVVADEPGTTRDAIEEAIVLDGLPFRLADTAGLGQPGRGPERLAARQAREALDRAHVVVLVLDGGRRSDPADREILERLMPRHPTLVVAMNKSDREEHRDAVDEVERWSGLRCLSLCARTGVGLGTLVRSIRTAAGLDRVEDHLGAPTFFTPRQLRLAHRALAALRDAPTGGPGRALTEVRGILHGPPEGSGAGPS